MASQNDQSNALSENRRIYLGNLDYALKPQDIEESLAASGFENFDNIHISIDPISSRNPGYCFVDFTDRDTAERALSELNLSLRGRQLKVGPCEPKKKRGGDDRAPFQRWGDWNAKETGQDGKNNNGSHSSSYQRSHEQGPRGAMNHYDGIAEDPQRRRLYVGGLGRMVDQPSSSQEMVEIFSGFTPRAIGKRITPHESTQALPGNHHYCFVDFDTAEEADLAAQALDGKPYGDGVLKVHLAKSNSNRRPDARRENDGRGWRSSDNNQGSGNKNNHQRQQNSTSSGRALASMDWRRKAPE